MTISLTDPFPFPGLALHVRSGITAMACLSRNVRGMKRPPTILAIVAVLAVAWFLFAGFRSSPLKGRLKAATVTMQYFSREATNSEGLHIFEKTVRIQDAAEIAAVENSLSRVRNSYGANSMEGLPKYRMQVEYIDGTTQQFVFTKTEWGGSGFTPVPLLEVLERNGL